MEHQHQPEAPAKKATDDHSKMDHGTKQHRDNPNDPAEILFITSYPPRECGIATFSRDLINALNNKFSDSVFIKVCALESGDANYLYSSEVKYILNTSVAAGFARILATYRYLPVYNQ